MRASFRAVVAGFGLLLASAPAPASVPTPRDATACLCIWDRRDSATRAECENWMSRRLTVGLLHPRVCDDHGFFERDDFSAPAGIAGFPDRASRAYPHLLVFGAFHASRARIGMVFQIADRLVTYFGAQSIDYEGDSCEIFNDVDQLPKLAEGLRSHPGVAFRLSGNQNLGVARGILGGFQENPRTKSRVTVSVREGKATVDYPECSPVGEVCAVDPDGVGTGVDDLNVKGCTSEGVLTAQRCCPRVRAEGREFWWGKWAAPGEACVPAVGS